MPPTAGLSYEAADIHQMSAPSATHVARMVAMRELTEQLMSLRFLLIVVLVLGLTPLAIYVGTRDFKARLENAQRLVAEQQAVVSGPEGMVVKDKVIRGYDIPWARQDELIALRTIRLPEPLSVLVRGLDGAMPQYWDYLPTGTVPGPAAAQPQKLADILGQLDLEFLVRVALGLLAILLAFDAISGEKELGTLRAVLSQPVSRSAVLTGKLTGGAVTLLLSLTAAFLLALLSSQLMGVDLVRRDDLAKLGLLGLTSAAYLLCFYSLGLFISAMSRSQKTSLVVLLVVWVLAVFAVPPTASLIGKAIHPTIPANSLQTRKRSLDDDIRSQAQQDMGTVYREITGVPEGSAYSTKYNEHKDAIDRRIAPILIGYLNKRRQLMSELDREAERRETLQNSLTRGIMAVSPAAAFANAATDLVGTGDAQRAAWFEAAYRQQSSLNSVLFEDPPTITIANGGAMFAAERRKPPMLSELPQFTPPRHDTLAVVTRSLPSIGLLIAAMALFVLGGFVAFSRYDVR